MTGAALPAGADAVCMVERTRSEDGWVVVDDAVTSGTNLRLPGDDIAPGAEVFAEGVRLGPAHLGVLASLGVEEVSAYPCPVCGRNLHRRRAGGRAGPGQDPRQQPGFAPGPFAGPTALWGWTSVWSVMNPGPGPDPEGGGAELRRRAHQRRGQRGRSRLCETRPGGAGRPARPMATGGGETG